MALRRRNFISCACCAAVPALAAAADVRGPDRGFPQLLELGTQSMTRLAPTVWVARIAPSVWLHTTTGLIAGGLFYPANGLILERKTGCILIDTGWNPGQADTLMRWCNGRGRPVVQAVATHFHADRTGGIPALRRAGIPIIGFPLTCALAKRHHMPAPDPLAGFASGAHAVDDDLELFFPGPGHTPDNILAWLPREHVLFGGCFLKSATTHDLGYVADAVISAWPASLRRVRNSYAAASLVVPGHGTVHGDSLAATAALLAKT